MAGQITATMVPWAFEGYPTLSESWLRHLVGGVITGVGVYLGNGCTVSDTTSLAGPTLRQSEQVPDLLHERKMSKFGISGSLGPLLPFQSGHGLAGISRLSLRSATATPIFMGVAAATVMVRTQFATGPMTPIVSTPTDHFLAEARVAAAALVLGLPMAFLDGDTLSLYSGLWTGVTFGSGLAIGGMVRVSAVMEALGPAR